MLRLRRSNPLGQCARQGAQPLRSQQRHEMIVGQQTPHGVGDEQQPAARQGGALDQQLLPFRFALIGADQALRCDRLLGATNPRSALVELLAAWVALFRSEERRVGKECVRTFRSRWSTYL